ncbi:MAG: polymer-forming cytoskeletal protein [Lachnospiraceae bacterium]|nr:polymer-forming cytoskeletal protein [Lachnospiraceae bacterium]
MGFFQDLKQDLSQTVADINVDDAVDDIGLGVDLPTSSEDLFGSTAEGDFADLEAMLEKEAAALGDTPVAVSGETVQEELPAGLEGTDNESETEPKADAEEKAEPESLPEIVPEPAGNMEEENKDNIISEADTDMEELLNEVEQNIEEPVFMDAAPQEALHTGLGAEVDASTDTAVITEGMNITGDVTSSGNMDLIGNITGNIEILGKLNVTGSVTGNSAAAEIYAESAQINGEIKSKGSVKIGQSSVVIGNIFATSAVIAGAVKGDIDVHGPVILDTSAIVMGNIKSKSVQINNGAVIEGMCSQCYADVSPTSFFNDVKKNRK